MRTLAEQISAFQGLIYMREQFMEKYLLPTMQIRKLLETESEVARGDQPLPGGPVKEYPVYRVRAIEGKAPHSGSSQNTIYI